MDGRTSGGVPYVLIRRLPEWGTAILIILGVLSVLCAARVASVLL